jgi:phosphopantothenoylcysteine decarboxylase/phosphopantothenate--cysteine ligase
MEHIALAKWADFLLICPATANTIAKIAHGIADNLLTSLALSFEKRIVIAPAMNTAMWENSATKENIKTLITRGAHVLPVGEGELACGDIGSGRLIELETVVDFIASLKTPKYLAHKKVLISSGPTCEPLDPVRVITNRSSGKMGAALARAAWLAGAQVTIVSGPTSVALPFAVKVVRVKTALEMLAAMEGEFPQTDVCILAAAVSDFRPTNVHVDKIHRLENAPLNLELTANPDIAALLGAQKKGTFLVGFSLETGGDDARPLEKMKKKNCDMMIVNLADVALDSDKSAARILYADRPPENAGLQDKSLLAELIIKRIALSMGLTHD